MKRGVRVVVQCELSDYVEYAGGSEDGHRSYGIAIAHKPKL